MIHARMVLMTALWGMLFVANHQLLRSMDATQIVTLRFLLVSMVFGAAIVARPELRPRLSRREWLLMCVCGALAVPGTQITVVVAQNYLPPSSIALLVATGPVFVAMIAAGLLDERLRVQGVVGLVVALAGSAIVAVASAGKATSIAEGNPIGAIIVLLSQLSWAAYTVLSKPVTERLVPIAAVGIALIVGTVMLLPFYPHAFAGVALLGRTEWLWLAYLAVAGTVVPYLIWFSTLGHMQANQVAAYLYLIPLFGVLWSAVILGDFPPLGALAGGGVIVTGVALTQLSRTPEDVAVEARAGPLEGG